MTNNRISLVLGALAFLLGFIVALGVLVGDDEGRVNLLYLLLLFAFIPVAGLLLSLVFILRAHARGLAGWLLELPWWPRQWHWYLRTLQNNVLRKFWLFYQTQVMALGFGLGGLLAFFILLLGTDMSFVWRSTLMEAPDLFPVLRALALPWWYWLAAQPTMELLQQSQDFRLAVQENTAQELGQWWPYAFAALCTYNLVPRLVLLVFSGWYYRRLERRAALVTDVVTRIDEPGNTVPGPGRLADVVDSVKAPFIFVDWATTPASLIATLQRSLGEPVEFCLADPLSRAEDVEALQKREAASVVVLVKSWEAPLGELHDYLGRLRTSPSQPGILLPLDWDERGVHAVTAVHLQEWRRFAGALTNWRVLQLPLSTAQGEAP